MTYELLDFGQGRKLERFGEIVLDRPSPAAEEFARQNSSLWKSAHARFELDFRNASEDLPERGRWIDCAKSTPWEIDLSPWTIAFPWFRMELKCTPFGHLGIFPEQYENWSRIFSAVKRRCTGGSEPFRLLNLFAYTGGSTLAAAAAGANVTHIDAAKNLLPWFKRNVELSELTEAPIRRIAEDALLFVQREIKRGSKYEAIVLDPPSFGRGPKGQSWNLARDLPELLRCCVELLSENPGFVLLTNHSPQHEAKKLTTLFKTILRDKPTLKAEYVPLNMEIRSRSAATLPAGHGLWAEFDKQCNKSTEKHA